MYYNKGAVNTTEYDIKYWSLWNSILKRKKYIEISLHTFKLNLNEKNIYIKNNKTKTFETVEDFDWFIVLFVSCFSHWNTMVIFYKFLLWFIYFLKLERVN